jgi:hypothetical protein
MPWHKYSYNIKLLSEYRVDYRYVDVFRKSVNQTDVYRHKCLEQKMDCMKVRQVKQECSYI